MLLKVVSIEVIVVAEVEVEMEEVAEVVEEMEETVVVEETVGTEVVVEETVEVAVAVAGYQEEVVVEEDGDLEAEVVVEDDGGQGVEVVVEEDGDPEAVDGVDVDAKYHICTKTATCVKLKKKTNKAVVTLFLCTFYADP